MKRFDFLLLISTIGLVLFSAFFVYSSSVDQQGHVQSIQFSRQLLFIIVGMVIMGALSFIPIHKVKGLIPILYIIVLITLILTLIVGEVRNGAKSWLHFFGFSLQVSEFAKLISVLMYAFIIERYAPQFDNYKTIILYIFIGCIPMGIILLQPDLGTSLVYIPIMLTIFYIAGVNGRRVLFVAGAGFIAIGTLILSYAIQSAISSDLDNIALLRTSNFIVYVMMLLLIIPLSALGQSVEYLRKFFTAVLYCASMLVCGAGLAYMATIVLKPYQIQRLLVFVNPESDPLGSGWHILQSVLAIGSGGLFGAGFMQGRQSSLQFLPQKSTDFIFSLIGEELGFFGSLSVIVLFTVLMWRIIIIGMRSKTIFARIYCAGILALFLTHFMVNIGMTLGIMPITGIPLLLISYGGSSMLTAFCALGVLHSIYRTEAHCGGYMQF